MTAAFDPRFLLLALIVLASYVAGTVSGFGVIVIATTLGAQLYPLKELLPVLVPMSLVLTSIILIRHHEHIDRALLWKRILPLMSVGVVIGMALFHVVDTALMRTGFGMLVVVLAVSELWRLLRNRPDERPHSHRHAAPWLLASGLVHGLFATGGPPLVYALSRMKLDKSVFRSTLTAVWLVLNIVMTGSYIVAGRIGTGELKAMGFLLPLVPIGLAVGERIHGRIDERRFRMVVFATLLVAGGALCR